MPERRGNYPQLNERQVAVFTTLLQEYVVTARAVGSQTLSRRLREELSPATIRNTMADLEEMGLLAHMHTSAGRVPTTLGYGLYVDLLMDRVEVSREAREHLRQAIQDTTIGGLPDLLDRASEALAHTSALISVVLTPKLAGGILHKIDLVRIATGRLLVVLTIRHGFVRSILLEISSSIADKEIEAATRLLNKRLSGLRLEEVKRSITARLSGVREAASPLIKLVVNAADQIFDDRTTSELHVDGTPNVLQHPEFADLDRMKGVIEILEDREVILHVLWSGEHETAEGVRISIGEEVPVERLQGCSVVAAAYTIGDTEGALGIIGPTRMDYARLVPLVNFAATAINRRLDD
ncbi:MAG: heat-inducible transcriptional repressor HrcA [bacterium]